MKVFSIASSGEARKTGHIVRAEVEGKIPRIMDNVQGVEIPPPKVTDISMPFDELAIHLAGLYMQAVKWSGANRKNTKKYFFIAKAKLSADSFSLARRMKAALREIADTSGSKLPMSMYAWWYVNMTFEKYKDIPSPEKVFNPDQITSARWRKYYWTDCGQVVATMPKVWARVDQDLVNLHRDLHTYDSACVDVNHAVWLWEAAFSSKYADLVRLASLQRGVIRDSIRVAHDKYSIGVYLYNPVKALRLGSVAIDRLA